VAHAYNPSYSGDRNQEDHSSKPTQATSSQDPVLENPTQNRAEEWLNVGPEFKHKKKRQKKENLNGNLP
jgi:hypothetical protein